MRAAALALVALLGCREDDVSRTLGARCDTTSECDDRCLEPSPKYPDGFCTVDCTTSGDCPDLSHCIENEGGVCLFQCSVDRECAFLGEGWRCLLVDLRGMPGEQRLVCIGS